MKRGQAIRDLFALSEVEPEIAEPARHRTSRPIHISGRHRESHDFYATPDWVTEALLSRVRFRGHVWEHAAALALLRLFCNGTATA